MRGIAKRLLVFSGCALVKFRSFILLYLFRPQRTLFPSLFLSFSPSSSLLSIASHSFGQSRSLRSFFPTASTSAFTAPTLFALLLPFTRDSATFPSLRQATVAVRAQLPA